MSFPDDNRMVLGLQAIIDAAALVLGEVSLESTLQAMAHALRPVVPFTSLAVFRLDPGADVLVPMVAEGLWVQETLASRPPLHGSTSGRVAQTGEVVVILPDDSNAGRHHMPGTPDDLPEA